MTEHMDGCLFCKIAKKEIPAKLVYEDDWCVAFSDIRPQAPIHLLVVPRQHVTDLADLAESNLSLITQLVGAAHKVAQKMSLLEDGYRLVINSGKNGGQTVFHLHLHVLGGRKMTWPPG